MTHQNIISTKSFYPEQSGCAALIAIYAENILTCVNLGNARAVLFKENSEGKIYAK